MGRARLFAVLATPTVPPGARGRATVSQVPVTGAASGGTSRSPGLTLIRGEGNSGF